MAAVEKRRYEMTALTLVAFFIALIAITVVIAVGCDHRPISSSPTPTVITGSSNPFPCDIYPRTCFPPTLPSKTPEVVQ